LASYIFLSILLL
ncbi:Hypothetical protein EIN_199800, partial [Entamoeba invadens IP1]